MTDFAPSLSDAELVESLEAIGRRLAALRATADAPPVAVRQLEDIRADLRRLAEETTALKARLDNAPTRAR